MIALSDPSCCARKQRQSLHLQYYSSHVHFSAIYLHFLFISFRFTGKAQKDWSWRIRFAAVQGLVRICRQCGGDKTKDGMCGVAWNQLMRHHSSERDVRVLEAWKLAQVCEDR